MAHETAGAARTRSSLRPLLRVACALFIERDSVDATTRAHLRGEKAEPYPRRPGLEPGPITPGVSCYRRHPAHCSKDTTRRMGPGSRPGRRGYMRRHSRDIICPSCAIHPPPRKKRAQGRPGARCTRGLMCMFAHLQKAHMSIQVQRRASGLPCAMVLTAYIVLSPVSRAFLPPSLAD
jgi:hypothetical protein